ncbi:MAG: DUF488 domain-containing protein [Ktedonobacteraceae bacterium]
MEKIPIYTIGYGNRSIEEFMNLLEKYHIQYLADIRSRPYSKFNPDFSQVALEKRLKQQHIKYLFLGDTLGGRPDDSNCYVDGKVDYQKVRQTRAFQEGIQRIHDAWDKQLPVALMCSELKPEECHRSKLVGSTLTEQHITVAHIDEEGNCKTQDEVLQIITGNQPSLFPDIPHKKVSSSRKKYTAPGEAVQ